MICDLFLKKMVKTAELTKLEQGKFLDLHVSGKSIHEISKMLKIPKSMHSSIYYNTKDVS